MFYFFFTIARHIDKPLVLRQHLCHTRKIPSRRRLCVYVFFVFFHTDDSVPAHTNSTVYASAALSFKPNTKACQTLNSTPYIHFFLIHTPQATTKTQPSRYLHQKKKKTITKKRNSCLAQEGRSLVARNQSDNIISQVCAGHHLLYVFVAELRQVTALVLRPAPDLLSLRHKKKKRCA